MEGFVQQSLKALNCLWSVGRISKIRCWPLRRISLLLAMTWLHLHILSRIGATVCAVMYFSVFNMGTMHGHDIIHWFSNNRHSHQKDVLRKSLWCISVLLWVWPFKITKQHALMRVSVCSVRIVSASVSNFSWNTGNWFIIDTGMWYFLVFFFLFKMDTNRITFSWVKYSGP